MKTKMLDIISMENGLFSISPLRINAYRCPYCKEVNLINLSGLNIENLEKELKEFEENILKKISKENLFKLKEKAINQINEDKLNISSRRFSPLTSLASSIEELTISESITTIIGIIYEFFCVEYTSSNLLRLIVNTPFSAFKGQLIQRKSFPLEIEDIFEKDLQVFISEILSNIRKNQEELERIKESGYAKFDNIKNKFFIQEDSYVCGNCNEKIEKISDSNKRSDAYFLNAVIKENREKLVVVFYYRRSNIWLSNKVEKVEIKGFNDKVMFTIVFNTKTGQTFRIHPYFCSNGKRRIMAAPIINITNLDEEFIFPNSKDIYFEKIPKKVLNEIAERLMQKHKENLSSRIVYGEINWNLLNLISFNRAPKLINFFLGNKEAEFNGLSKYKNFIKGYLPEHDEFELLKDFKYKKSIRKLFAKNLSTIVAIRTFDKVKDVNNMLKIVNWFNNDWEDQYFYFLKKLEISRFLAAMIKETGETITVNKVVKSSLGIFLDTANMYVQIKENEKLGKQKLLEKNFFKRKTIKEIHDEFSMIIVSFQHNNIVIDYKEGELMEGIFGSIYFAFPKETLEIVKTGKKMGICVGGSNYIERVLKRKINIIIGYKKVKKELVPMICIEHNIKNKEIVQVKGIFNKAISEELLKSFDLWISHYNKISEIVSHTSDIKVDRPWNNYKLLGDSYSNDYFDNGNIELGFDGDNNYEYIDLPF